MHLHLIEPMSSGHRLEYVRRLLHAAPATGATWSLSVFPSSRRHPAFATASAGLAPGSVHDIAGEDGIAAVLRLGGLRQSAAWWDLLHAHWSRLPAEARGDVVVLPYLDYVLKALAWRGSPFDATPFAGIAMRPTFHHRAMGVEGPRRATAPFERALFTRALRTPGLAALLTIDETLSAWVQRRRPRLAPWVAYVQDPADLQVGRDRAGARARFGIAAQQRAILVFGAISQRKGLAELSAALNAPECPRELTALVVGRWQDDVRALRDDAAWRSLVAAGRAQVHDAWVDAEDEALAFAAADVVWLGYRDFQQSSGVLMQAAQARLPVVGCREGLIGWQIRQHGLGLSVDPRDAAGVRAALVEAARPDRAAPAVPERFVRPPDFGGSVVRAIAERMPGAR